jgi:hypothetical protein
MKSITIITANVTKKKNANPKTIPMKLIKTPLEFLKNPAKVISINTLAN